MSKFEPTSEWRKIDDVHYVNLKTNAVIHEAYPSRSLLHYSVAGHDCVRMRADDENHFRLYDVELLKTQSKSSSVLEVTWYFDYVACREAILGGEVFHDKQDYDRFFCIDPIEDEYK